MLIKGVRIGIHRSGRDIWGTEVVRVPERDRRRDYCWCRMASPYWRGKTEHRINNRGRRSV